MGYDITQRASNFSIKAESMEPALAALKEVTNAKHEAGTHFAWVVALEVVRATTLKEALKEWRWDLGMSLYPEGGAYDIEFTGEKSGDEEVLFSVLAPFVEPDSYIEMQGENGESWRWVFDGTDMHYVEADEVTWGGLTDVIVTTEIVKGRKYSCFVMFDDQTWVQPTYVADRDMTEAEFKERVNKDFNGFLVIGVDTDEACLDDDAKVFWDEADEYAITGGPGAGWTVTCKGESCASFENGDHAASFVDMMNKVTF